MKKEFICAKTFIAAFANVAERGLMKSPAAAFASIAWKRIDLLKRQCDKNQDFSNYEPTEQTDKSRTPLAVCHTDKRDVAADGQPYTT